MNKTININLGGLFFHIDETAFNKLKTYLDAISNSLNDEPQGKEEIIKDIEQRISELLSEKISDERQVINEKDIDEVIAIMGQPEDYIYDDELFAEQQAKNGPKKLYRDSTDKILGGVSSGLGHYLKIDAAWIRILWIVITLFYGTGILAYIILWIILPEATTTSEILEMKGEAVNIGNIEKKIKAEYEKLEDKVKNADYAKVKSGFQDFLDTIGRIIVGIFKVLVKVVGVLLLIIATSAVVGLVISLFTWGGAELLGFDPTIQIPPFMKGSIIPDWLLALAVILATLIPFIFLFILGINILSKDKKSMGLAGNLSLLGVWILSLIVIAFATVEHNNQFATADNVMVNHEINMLEKDTLFIQMRANDKIANRKSLYRSRSLEQVVDSMGDEKLYSSYIHVDIRKSNSEEAVVKILKTARGINRKKAKEKADKIDYKFAQQGKKLLLDAYFLTPLNLENSKPKIDVIIYVPENQYVYFDANTEAFLYDVHNAQDLFDGDMPKHLFIMNEKELDCMDCETASEEIETPIIKDTLNL